MKLKDEDINKIIEMKRKGLKIREIAETFGVSPRRIQQILKNPRLKRPGRKRIELPEEIREEIIRMRNTGYTIDDIRQTLKCRGYSISRYKVWKTLREHKEQEFIKVVEEFQSLCNSHYPVFFLGASPLVSCEDGRSLKFLLICNVSECRVLYCNAFESLTLRDVINAFDSHALRFQKPELVIILPTPPLVPTRCSGNRFTNHLKNLKIPYVWFPESLKKACQGEIERIKNLFREKCSCSHYMIRELKGNCKGLLEVHQHGGTKKDKEVFKNPDCRGNKKL
ncbi:hypothetical protein [Thermococcus sp.]